MGLLRNAGLITTQQGSADSRVSRSLDRITMLDVLRAVEPDPNLFSIHQNPNPACPVGARIQNVLETVYSRAQVKMEQELERTTMADILSGLKAKAP